MLTAIKHKLSTPSKISGVSIEILSKGSYKVNYVSLEKKKQKLEVLSSSSSVTSLNELFSLIDKKNPVALAISGVGVIHKKLQFDNLDLVEALPYILPNSKPLDFVYQKCPSTTDSSFYSIIRSDVLNSCLQEFYDNDFDVIDVTLGPFSVNSILPLIKNETGDLHIDKHTFEFNRSGLMSISPNRQSPSSEVIFEDTKIDGDLVNAYSTGFQTIVGLPNKISVVSDGLKNVQQEYLQKKIFRIGGWAALLTLLVILLTNFIADGHLSTENNKLEENYATDSLLLSQSDILEKEVEEKESFLRKAGWLDVSRSSYFLDQLAAMVPDDVLLTKLSYQPIDKLLSREQRKRIYEIRTIYIEGVTKNGTTLNPWIKNIENQAWVSKVDVLGYEYDSKLKRTAFKIAIEF